MKKQPDDKQGYHKQTIGKGIKGKRITITGNQQTVINNYSPKLILFALGFFGLLIGGVWFIFIPKQTNTSNSQITNNYNNQKYDNSSEFLINNPLPQLPGQNFPVKLQKKEAEQKIIIYEKEVEKNPKSAVAYTNLGEAKRRAGDLEDAAKAHKKALQLNPNLVEAKLGQALVEQDKGNTAQAKQEIQDVLIRGEAAAGFYYLGAIFFLQKPQDLQGAEAVWRKAVELESKNLKYKLCLAVALMLQEKYEEALSEINEVIRIQPNNKEAYLYLSDILKAQNKISEAISALRTLFKINNDGHEDVDSYGHNILGKIFDEQGKEDAAIAEYKEAIRLFYFNAIAHKHLGEILSIQGAHSKNLSKINEGISELKLASKLYRDNDDTETADEIDKIINLGKRILLIKTPQSQESSKKSH